MQMAVKSSSVKLWRANDDDGDDDDDIDDDDNDRLVLSAIWVSQTSHKSHSIQTFFFLPSPLF